MELKFTGVSNTFDCHRNLQPMLAKDASKKSPSILPNNEWDKDSECASHILENTDEYNSTHPQHLQEFYFDRNDAPTMHPLPNAQNMC